MKRYLILGLLSLSLVLSGFANAAQRERDRDDSRGRQGQRDDEWRDLKEPGKGWELLAEHKVNYRDDRDRIKVGDVGRHDGRFKQLQLRVDGAPVEIRRMVVNFENGDSFDAITKRHRFDEGSRTLVVDLPGDRRRNIKDIDIDYFSVSQREGRGVILVYAR